MQTIEVYMQSELGAERILVNRSNAGKVDYWGVHNIFILKNQQIRHQSSKDIVGQYGVYMVLISTGLCM